MLPPEEDDDFEDEPNDLDDEEDELLTELPPDLEGAELLTELPDELEGDVLLIVLPDLDGEELLPCNMVELLLEEGILLGALMVDLL